MRIRPSCPLTMVRGEEGPSSRRTTWGTGEAGPECERRQSRLAASDRCGGRQKSCGECESFSWVRVSFCVRRLARGGRNGTTEPGPGRGAGPTTTSSFTREASDDKQTSPLRAGFLASGSSLAPRRLPRPFSRTEWPHSPHLRGRCCRLGADSPATVARPRRLSTCFPFPPPTTGEAP